MTLDKAQRFWREWLLRRSLIPESRRAAITRSVASPSMVDLLAAALREQECLAEGGHFWSGDTTRIGNREFVTCEDCEELYQPGIPVWMVYLWDTLPYRLGRIARLSTLCVVGILVAHAGGHLALGYFATLVPDWWRWAPAIALPWAAGTLHWLVWSQWFRPTPLSLLRGY